METFCGPLQDLYLRRFLNFLRGMETLGFELVSALPPPLPKLP